jgi:hypothetical protein
MLMVNHALTGVILGHAVQNHWILVPVALASHLVLDAIPHFGHPESSLRSRRWHLTGLFDGLATCVLLLLVCLMWPTMRPHLLLGAFMAVLPDLFYVPEILLQRRVTGWFGRWHHRIQWGENPTGWLVDAGWFAFIVWFLYNQPVP